MTRREEDWAEDWPDRDAEDWQGLDDAGVGAAADQRLGVLGPRPVGADLLPQVGQDLVLGDPALGLVALEHRDHRRDRLAFLVERLLGVMHLGDELPVLSFVLVAASAAWPWAEAVEWAEAATSFWPLSTPGRTALRLFHAPVAAAIGRNPPVP